MSSFRLAAPALVSAAALMLLAACSHSSGTPPSVADASPPAAAPAAAGPDKLVISFAKGGSTLTPEAQAQLDEAARLYRDGKPLKMYVAGYTDSQGDELKNLLLSAHRAEAVKTALVSRGIPADRLQATAQGENDPVVPTPTGTAEPQNRRVVVTWK